MTKGNSREIICYKLFDADSMTTEEIHEAIQDIIFDALQYYHILDLEEAKQLVTNIYGHRFGGVARVREFKALCKQWSEQKLIRYYDANNMWHNSYTSYLVDLNAPPIDHANFKLTFREIRKAPLFNINTNFLIHFLLKDSERYALSFGFIGHSMFRARILLEYLWFIYPKSNTIFEINDFLNNMPLKLFLMLCGASRSDRIEDISDFEVSMKDLPSFHRNMLLFQYDGISNRPRYQLLRQSLSVY